MTITSGNIIKHIKINIPKEINNLTSESRLLEMDANF